MNKNTNRLYLEGNNGYGADQFGKPPSEDEEGGYVPSDGAGCDGEAVSHGHGDHDDGIIFYYPN